MADSSDYLPISDYGLIGDCHGAALVSRCGAIDWCCLHRFDADPLFARILDAGKGGTFVIRPEDVEKIERRYMSNTNILESTFTTKDATVVLTDFMAVRDEAGLKEREMPSVLVRMVEVREGHASITMRFEPRPNFGQEEVALEMTDGVIHGVDEHRLHLDVDAQIKKDVAQARWEQEAGEIRSFILSSNGVPKLDDIGAEAKRLLSETTEYWRDWTSRTSFEGPYAEAVGRSALVLKLLTYVPTGAIIAAPSAALPEEIGGIRNWDYRYSWPRDSSYTFYSLKKLGHSEEADDYFRFLMDAACEREMPLPPLFDIEGETDLSERKIAAFEGYRGSSPVNIGNGAVEQRQNDIYGQILDLMHLYKAMGGELNDRMTRFGRWLADYVAGAWRVEDSGIWEPRLPEQRFVHSAIMCWVALDRAIKLFGEEEHWKRERDAVIEDIRANAVHADGYLTQVFGGEDVDAAVLVAAAVDLPIGRDVLERTVDEIIDKLGAGSLVYRYKTNDGLPGEEGTFLVCAFWLIDALLLLDRKDEARKRFEGILAQGNDVGLLSEEMGEDGTFLGNFPQGLTHLGLLQSALMLDLHDNHGVEGIRGTYADRVLRQMSNRRSGS
ncbi:MAG TPA: glycoside hydrolase family 15 protein [Saliniramus sp.]|nr:glycoside hydrolase family 15 protein [Saliniramus sp.]